MANRKPSDISVYILTRIRIRDEKNERWLGSDKHFGVVFTERGVFFLESEGVGYFPRDIPEVYLWNLKDPNDKESKISEIFPVASFNLDPSSIAPDDFTGETLPLELFIRSFGIRLEQNYDLWLRYLKKERIIKPRFIIAKEEENG